MTKYLLITLAALITVIVLQCSTVNTLRRERNTYADNQRALLDDVTFYRTADSLSAASVERLRLTTTELRRHNADLADRARTLGIRLSRLQSITATSTASTYAVTAPIVDTLYLPADAPEGTPPDTLHCLCYHSPWIDITGCLSPTTNTFNGTIATRDTLTQIIHRIPRRFLFFRWGTKAIRQEILSSNPHTTITATEYIDLRK